MEIVNKRVLSSHEKYDSKRQIGVYIWGGKMLKSFKVGGRDVPYYHFLYDKNLHVLLRRKNYWKAKNRKLDNGKSIMEYLTEETYKQFDFNSNYPVFERAVMLIIQYFRDKRMRDMDNYVYKPIVDTIRKTGIIMGDDYRHLSLFYVGQPDIKDCIGVYVIPYAYFVDFAKEFFYELTDPFIEIDQIKTINEVRKKQCQPETVTDPTDQNSLVFFN